MHLTDGRKLPPAHEAVNGHEDPRSALFTRSLHLLHFMVGEHDPLVEDDAEDAPHQLGHILLDQGRLLLVLSLQGGGGG